ncbi:hypothetical protein BC830DRAFT_1145315 [Chytriomyces sp. MP71]|nr:hypothetical protein BC830DRAFT_1145315 [Chytriomyces sp. MP71]
MLPSLTGNNQMNLAAALLANFSALALADPAPKARHSVRKSHLRPLAARPLAGADPTRIRADNVSQRCPQYDNLDFEGLCRSLGYDFVDANCQCAHSQSTKNPSDPCSQYGNFDMKGWCLSLGYDSLDNKCQCAHAQKCAWYSGLSDADYFTQCSAKPGEYGFYWYVAYDCECIQSGSSTPGEQ